MADEFDCTGCGRHIVRFAKVDDEPICGFCRIYGGRRGKVFQDWQDGLISDADFKAGFDREETS